MSPWRPASTARISPASFHPHSHSISSHSSAIFSVAISRSWAGRTRTRAKRPVRRALVPSRQPVVRQLFFGSGSARCSTLTGLLPPSCTGRTAGRPRPGFLGGGASAAVPGALGSELPRDPAFVLDLMPATYVNPNSVVSVLKAASARYPASARTTPRGSPVSQAHFN